MGADGRVCSLLYDVHDAVPCSLYSDSPVSSRPQPFWSRREAALCEDTREDFGLSI